MIKELEKAVPDHIHDFVTIDDKDYKYLQNDFARRELTRLSNLAHLGLIGKLRRLARHDKLEHAYGTYWLCKECIEYKPTLIEDTLAFKLAGLFHSIGHLSFSYDTEYAVGKLYEIHKPTRTWIDNVFDTCADFTGDQGVKKAAERMKGRFNCAALHRWFGSYKLASSGKNEFNTDLGRQIVRILVDNELMRHQLLNELDKLDFVSRDMMYLAFGRIDLNFPIVLSRFDQSHDGTLITPDLSAIIDGASDCLCREVFRGHEEQCLQQVMEKGIVREVIGGHISIGELFRLESDDDLENALLGFKSGTVNLQSCVERIRSEKIEEVTSIPVDLWDSSPIELEMDLAGTNRAGIHNYSDRLGLYIQCRPNPYYFSPPALDYALEGSFISLVYDQDSKHAANVITALSRAERWLPTNAYGMKGSCRTDAFKFLIGGNVHPHFDRYYDIMDPIVKVNLPGTSDELKPEFFSKSWSLQEQAPELLSAFEAELGSRVQHFIEFPEHWNTEIISKVISDSKNVLHNARKSHKEDVKSFEARKEKILEYVSYLETVLRIQESALIGWALPSAWILEKNGSRFREVDVITAYVEKKFRGPVKVDLLEVSVNASPDNREENRKKLRDIAHRIRSRFPRNVVVEGFFNSEKVVPPY